MLWHAFKTGVALGAEGALFILGLLLGVAVVVATFSGAWCAARAAIGG